MSTDSIPNPENLAGRSTRRQSAKRGPLVVEPVVRSWDFEYGTHPPIGDRSDEGGAIVAAGWVLTTTLA